ncbi:MAG: aspartate aminotransferase family protein [Vulcanimicrobiaceae bacterium]
MSDEFEATLTEIPGPRSRELAAALAARETRGVTFVSRDVPVFWERALGSTVTDVDGNRYLDLTAAFGVAVAGHSNPAVARAIAQQAERLAHGMGDVHPSEVKVKLLEKLAALAPVDDGKVFLCSSGAESVEFALKTALLATGEPNVLAFAGAYHGLSYGTLEVGGIPKFRKPWQKQLRDATTFVRFPDMREPAGSQRALEAVARALKKDRSLGAVLVEPIQGRAGVIIPPDGFLSDLRRLCDERDTLLIIDEIYTGFGRTGTLFASDFEAVRPDIVCLGKALAGGFPISATVVRGSVADAWEPSRGEALHTSTYLGNPMGCAAALANLAEIERLDLPHVARERAPLIAERLAAIRLRSTEIVDFRGRGMMWGVEFRDGAAAHACVVRALQAGLILLQSGLRGETIALTPPLTTSGGQLERALELLERAVQGSVYA